MKIIFYSPHPTHDIVTEVGYATHQRETIEALRALGQEVFPVVMGGTSINEIPYTTGQAIEHKGFKALLKKLIPRFIWVSLKDYKLMQHDKKAAKILEQAILKHQPDLIYERSEYLQDQSVAIIKKYNIKYFVEVNAPFIQEMSELEGKSIWINKAHKKEKNKYSFADKVFVVSSVLKDFLINQYQIDQNKILVSPNRINSQLFLSQSKFEADFNFNSNELVIGFVGSILPHHFVEELITAFDLLIKKNLNILLLIVGGGSLLEGLKTKVNTLNLNQQVIFLGKIPHQKIPSIIQKMDICVMPGSNWYGSPIKIFEYGILGKAVVAPNNGPVKDVMVNLQDGLLIGSQPEEIASALEILINNKELRLKLGANFKNKIEKEYNWQQAAEMILEAYQKA